MDVLKDLIQLVHHQTQDLDVDNNLEDEFKALKHRKYSLRLIQLLINNVYNLNYNVIYKCGVCNLELYNVTFMSILLVINF